jgi:cold shock CspA family protein
MGLNKDHMLQEYDLSKMGRLVRGKHADRMNQEGYSVMVHNEDGTTTIRYVSPEEVKERQAKRLTQGDKVSYDQVMGE